MISTKYYYYIFIVYLFDVIDIDILTPKLKWPMLFPFQRAGYLVHLWEQCGPSCKISARKVLQRQHLHHTKRKYRSTSSSLSSFEIVQVVANYLRRLSSHVLWFLRQLSWNPGFADTMCITGLGRRLKRCVFLNLDASTMPPPPPNFALLCLLLLMTSFLPCSGHLGRLFHGLGQGCWVGRSTGFQHGPVQGNTGWRIWQVLVILQTVCHPSTRPLLFTPERIWW